MHKGILFALVSLMLLAVAVNACGPGYICNNAVTPVSNYSYQAWDGQVYWQYEDYSGYYSYYGPAYYGPSYGGYYPYGSYYGGYNSYYSGYGPYYGGTYYPYYYSYAPTVYYYEPYYNYYNYNTYYYTPGFSAGFIW